MKKSLWLLCFSAFLLLTTQATAQEPKKPSQKEIVEKTSYAYGAMLSKGIAQMQLTKDERDPEQFAAGIKKGLEGDRAVFQAAQQRIQQRMQGQKPSATPDEARNIAFNLAITAIGGLASEIKIPASDFDLKVFKEGFKAAEAGKTLKYTDEEMDQILKDYFGPKNEEYKKAVEKKQAATASEGIEAGKKFMAENAKKKGVVTMPNGMQYEILKEGKGAKPTINDKVKTHYHGTLIDGKVFDSSVDRGQPATFPLNGVIKGWQEGIPLMSVGAKYRFYIPQELAYGMRSPSPKIPAGSTLIFEVELLDINPGQKELQETIKKGDAFLAENAKKKGVITTASGLQYKVIKEGSGAQPKLTDRVKVHYHGTLIDGTVFDSSVNRGEPTTFGVNQVIKGWQEGIPLMKVGSKVRLFIPQQLAYGTRATGKIPAGSALIFDVELFEINP